MTTEVASNIHHYKPQASGPIYHLGWGIRFFFAGLGMIVRHPALPGLCWIPIVVRGVLLVAMALGVTWLFGRLLADSFDNQFRLLLQVIVFIAVMLVSYFLSLPLARVVLAPFAEALS